MFYKNDYSSNEKLTCSHQKYNCCLVVRNKIMQAHVADNNTGNTDPCSGLQSLKNLVGIHVQLRVTTVL